MDVLLRDAVSKDGCRVIDQVLMKIASDHALDLDIPNANRRAVWRLGRDDSGPCAELYIVKSGTIKSQGLDLPDSVVETFARPHPKVEWYMLSLRLSSLQPFTLERVLNDYLAVA